MSATDEAPSHLLDEPPQVARKLIDAWCEERSQPRYRAGQILQHVFQKKSIDPQDMGNLPQPLRDDLARGILAPTLTQDLVQESKDGTRKFRFRLRDGAAIESVWIPSDERGTLCISSQAGCPAKCTFCATGAGGLRRNLSPAEIVEQYLRVDAAANSTPQKRVTQIVFMGMGEPLLNYAALKTALSLMTSADGFGFSPRRVTVSTVGIAPRMEELVRDFPQVRLALSLHSARDVTRDVIVPVNRKYPLAVLRKTLRSIATSARRVTLEVVHLAGVNDSPREAAAIARFAKDTSAHVNLLPFHPFQDAPYAPSDAKAVQRFREHILQDFSGEVTIRKSRGLDIDGACGQLAVKPKE